MALSDDQVAQVYEVFGIPQGGSAFVATKLISLFGPDGDTYDFTAVVTALDTQLAALTAEQITRVALVLARWVEITAYTPLRVSRGSSGAEGELVNYESERNALRTTLSNIVGFACPEGGFMASLGAGGGRLTR